MMVIFRVIQFNCQSFLLCYYYSCSVHNNHVLIRTRCHLLSSEIIAECGLTEVSSYMTIIQDNAEECVPSTLEAFSNALATTL